VLAPLAGRHVGVDGVRVEQRRLVLALPALRAGRPLPVSVTHLPRPRSGEEEALLHLVLKLRRFDWNRALVGVVAGLHLWGAVTLLAAPDSQLFTQGTRPVFTLFPPQGWAVPFLIGGAFTASLMWRLSLPRLAVAWFTVLPSQTVWLSASIIAVLSGGGSAMGVVFLSAVLAFTAITAIRSLIDYTSGKR
jgi:hypothetical protein